MGAVVASGKVLDLIHDKIATEPLRNLPKSQQRHVDSLMATRRLPKEIINVNVVLFNQIKKELEQTEKAIKFFEKELMHLLKRLQLQKRGLHSC